MTLVNSVLQRIEAYRSNFLFQRYGLIWECQNPKFGLRSYTIRDEMWLIVQMCCAAVAKDEEVS
jgi:hypothetical protein